MSVSVETHDLTRRFGGFTAVDRVSITVSRGEVFGFLGANGADKTTVIRMLCGLLRPTSGQATVAGLDVYRQSEAIKRRIGYMSQRFSLYEDLTSSENLEFYAGIYGLPNHEIPARRDELLQRFGLERHPRTLTSDLPLGFKQRLALACAQVHRPPILFLDEPTSGVDPAARRSFWDMISETASQGATIFVTTHVMEEAEYCHRVSIMDAGRIVALDTPARLKERSGKPTMQEAFISLAGP
jgi:ABC-2 type transport system ATP-binding protein